jgi:hypothetical protein
MSTLPVFVVIALMSLGLISVGEMISRSLKPKSAQSDPLDYEPVITAVSDGLIGTPDPTHHAEPIFGHIAQPIVHFLERFLHH